ncbi:uncharacterized protein LOC142905073 isoform X2 [Nelusetta ayraudi]
MIHQVDQLAAFAKQLHGLTEDNLSNFVGVDHNLTGLPHIEERAQDFSSLKVNQSLSKLYVHVQAYRLYVGWLKEGQENASLSSKAAQHVNTHLRHLSDLLSSSLQQLAEDVPQSPTAAPLTFSTAFDVISVSVEISERLQLFCRWSKRTLRQLQRQSGCPRH